MPTETRVRSLDVARGVVMVLMALDHVRVYAGIPAGGPTAGIFLTRWVTHFCAPAFVFLAGTAAFLHGRRLGETRTLARFLLIRGLLLVLLELTVIRFSWTFNVAYSEWVLAGVIWMLGWCMVLLAALVRLSPRTVGMIGVAIILFQQVFAMVPHLLPEPVRSSVGSVWEFFYPAGAENSSGITILYVLIPWIGVMAAGYGFGAIMTREPAERRRVCLRLGMAMTALFVIGGGLAVALSSAPADAPPALFRLLDQQKYPPSQPFLLMTLGPLIALLPFAETAGGPIARAFDTFGRVPMFYYLLHIPLIHVLALGVTMFREGAVHPEWYASAPYTRVPEEHRWSLAMLYLVFVVAVAMLFVACRWFAKVKAERPGSWLKYI